MKKYLLFILYITISCFSFAQYKNIDSLLALIKTDKEDTNKVVHLHKLCLEYQNVGDYKTALKDERQTLVLTQKLNWKKGEAKAYNSIGVVCMYQGNYPEALKNYFTALKLKEEMKDNLGIADSYNNIGNIYFYQGNYPEALKNYFASLKIREEIGDKMGIATSYNNLGIIYKEQNNYADALKNYLASLNIREEVGDKNGIASSYNNIGTIYHAQNNYPEALKNYLAALKIREEMNDKKSIASSYNNIGAVYYTQNNYPEALKIYLAALKIREKLGDKGGIAITNINLGQLYTKLNIIKKAEEYLNKGFALGKEIGSMECIKIGFAGLAILDSTTGNYKAAFEHHKLFIIYRDSLNNEETKKKSLQASMQYEFDKKEIAVKAEQDKLNAVTAEEKQKQQIIIYAVAGVLLLVIVFSLFLFNRFRITQKQKAVIEEQKILVDNAYESLHEKNKEVMDSIHYAKRIQTALITSETYINNQLNKLMKK